MRNARKCDKWLLVGPGIRTPNLTPQMLQKQACYSETVKHSAIGANCDQEGSRNLTGQWSQCW